MKFALERQRLSVEVYAGISTTPIADPLGDLRRAYGLKFSTFIPGGIYESASFQVSRNIAHYWQVNGANRLVFRLGLEIVFEGLIDSISNVVDANGESAVVVAVGYWGSVLMRRLIFKPWADSRLEKWEVQPSVSYEHRYTYTKNSDELRIIPKNDPFSNWASGGAFYYATPSWVTIKRITFDYDFDEDVGTWTLRLYDSTNASTEWSVTATGSGSQDVTLTTPSNNIRFELISGASQTPSSDADIRAILSAIVVYTETGNIDLTEIAKDILAEASELNSTETMIDSNTYDLTPFYTKGFESLADVLTHAANYGDSSQNAWMAYVDHSENAPTPDGGGVLVVEQKPTLDAFDYEISIEDIVQTSEIQEYYDDVWNDIKVEYRNARGQPVYTSSDDDTNLQDADSIAAFNQRDYKFIIDQTDATIAKNNARRFLAEHKDKRIKMSFPILIQGWVKSASGDFVPVAKIRAGDRVRISNYFRNISGDDGLLFMVSRTQYNDETGELRISAGDSGLILVP